MAFVAVHGGAGSHSPANDLNVKRALRFSCQKALSQQSQQNPALSIVEHAITTLEDEETFNAGFGSNLTLDGTVECDASIMDGDGAFGAVGAVSGIKNPICLSRAVLEHSQKPDPLGRIPPLVLVSEGARSFALRHSIPSVSPESLICARAKNSWVRWKEKYETGVPITDTDEGFELQDTVGSVAMCGHSLAAGVSRLANTFPSSSPFFFGIQIPSDSGGILLKFPGRMGEAGIFGAGCWAQRSAQRSVACSVSGAGEYITRASLARALGSAIVCSSEEDDPHDIIHRLLRDEFWDPSRKLGEPHPNVGVLVLTKEEEAGRTIVRLWCAFTTSSMALAFASTDNPKPKAFVLRQGAFTSDTDDCNPPIFITAYTLS